MQIFFYMLTCFILDKCPIYNLYVSTHPPPKKKQQQETQCLHHNPPCLSCCLLGWLFELVIISHRHRIGGYDCGHNSLGMTVGRSTEKQHAENSQQI
ncbi:hypothetical protein GDO86_007795 [Hymenochirus boettgeri]|uniref:Uncharacterized protein n=1 Tax=Hymenochirus boettgeri TaxID=247094 RepID=A0A8T2J2F7_9PIPI|nr:hypothetical protein GDO86_007795 [Hymenochirus boettgeri]